MLFLQGDWRRWQDTALLESTRSGQRCQRGKSLGVRPFRTWPSSWHPQGSRGFSAHWLLCGKLRGFGGWPPWVNGADRADCGLPFDGCVQQHTSHEKKQLVHRQPAKFVYRTLKAFNAGEIDAASASSDLGVSRSRLYQMRADFLRNKKGYCPAGSGGNHYRPWPQNAQAFLKEFLPLQTPPNFQLIADELVRLHEFVRSRSAVAAYAKKHFAHLMPHPAPKPRSRRRFRRAFIGELWQHDSSVHQWWAAPEKQTLLLTVDDASGFLVAGRFVSSDTTWNHFCHFRHAFETHGLPEAIYTDGLSLFGPSSTHDDQDPKSQFQRVLKAFGVAHLVAPSPQAKGKIERRFRTFQNRILALLSHAGTKDFNGADKILQMEINRQNDKVLRSTGTVPSQRWQEQLASRCSRLQPPPSASSLDLHLSLRCSRRVNADSSIDFEGLSYEISPTKRKSVTVLYHPNSKFWVLEHVPTSFWPPILASFTS